MATNASHPYSSLPPPIVQQIKELYISPTSSIQTALTQFSDGVGFPFKISIAWPSVIFTYGRTHKFTTLSEYQQIVPTITSFVRATIKTLFDYLEENDEENGPQEKFLTMCEQHESLWKRGLWVRLANVNHPRCYFVNKKRGWTGNGGWQWMLDIPVCWSLDNFRNDQGLNCWVFCRDAKEMVVYCDDDEVDDEFIISTSTENTLRKTGTEEWDVVDGPGDDSGEKSDKLGRKEQCRKLQPQSSLCSDKAPAGKQPVFPFQQVFQTPSSSPQPPDDVADARPLPDLATLLCTTPAPSLFINSLPHDFNHILIIKVHTGHIEIQGSHQATLKLIHGYFSQRVRVNVHRTDRPPLVRVEMLQSMWQAKPTERPMGNEEDRNDPEYENAEKENAEEEKIIEVLRLTNEGSWGTRLDQAYLVAFVEGVCGYRLVEGCTGETGTWIYRRRFLSG